MSKFTLEDLAKETKHHLSLMDMVLKAEFKPPLLPLTNYSDEQKCKVAAACLDLVEHCRPEVKYEFARQFDIALLALDPGVTAYSKLRLVLNPDVVFMAMLLTFHGEQVQA